MLPGSEPARRRRRSRQARRGAVRAVAGLIALVLVGQAMGACTTRSAREAGAQGMLDWVPCGDIECAELDVPLDPNHPAGPTITLALGRHQAEGRRAGVLLVNPGGPGAPGRDIGWLAASVPPEVRERFDMVGWDPRGVGDSTALRCARRLDDFWAADRSPDTAAEEDLVQDESRGLAQDCEAADPALLRHMATADTVADLDRIRQALGETQISFLGYSYGTVIGLGYLERHPSRLRSLVLDAPVDVVRDPDDLALEQAQGFERGLELFFDWCDRTADCRFGGGDSASAFDRLVRMVDQETLPGAVAGEDRELGPGLFDVGVAEALYLGRAGFADLAAALRAAAAGDGSPLIGLADRYTGRLPGGRYDGMIGAFYATGCSDPPRGDGVAGVRRLATQVAGVAPRLGPAGVWLGLPCAFWAVQPQGAAPERLPRPPDGPPVLVVGATDDPATPFAWAESVVRGLGPGASLVARRGDGHASFARGDDCVDGAVAAFLVNGTRPAATLRCG